MRSLYLIVSFLLLMRSPAQAEDARRDGNWWRQQTSSGRLIYALGFFDGMNLGAKFSYWGLPDAAAKPNPSVEVVLRSYSSMMDKYTKDVTNGLIADGLDKFYEDYRNRTILIENAVWLIVNAISGKSEKDMEIMIENFRKNAKVSAP